MQGGQGVGSHLFTIVVINIFFRYVSSHPEKRGRAFGPNDVAGSLVRDSHLEEKLKEVRKAKGRSSYRLDWSPRDEGTSSVGERLI